MQKYIYIITNSINNKVYIGQTCDLKRREREHFSLYNITNEKDHKILYLAMLKYGLENFHFAMLEGPIDDYNEREKFWIEKYNSLAPNGYNMTPGGEAPPRLLGEEHPMCEHTKEEIKQIQTLLATSSKTICEIAKQFNYNTSSINRINQGQLWYDEDLTYPLKKENTQQFKEERMKNIIQDLLYTTMTQKEIANKYSVSRTTITAINRGQNFYQEGIDYPIRKQNQHSKSIVMICQQTGKQFQEFGSAEEAARLLNLPTRASSNIRACANHKIKSAYGYIWEYIN